MKTTLLDIAKYKPGSKVWIVDCHISNKPIKLTEAQLLTMTANPNGHVHARQLYKEDWPLFSTTDILPKVKNSQFIGFMAMKDLKITIKQQEITSIMKSRGTGELYYTLKDHEGWQPEWIIHKTKSEASIEKDKITSYIKEWANKL